MSVGSIRPVGERIPAPAATLDAGSLCPDGYRCTFLQSGTAALALALRLCKRASDDKRRKVLIPAYACPDLVAAANYAGLEATLIDSDPDSPFMSLQALERALDDSVAAVVAVHFLGISERLEPMAKLASAVGAVLVEDSAQRIPDRRDEPLAPLRLVSFGRGKPVAGLGGGALFLRRDSGFDIAKEEIQRQSSFAMATALKRYLFNIAIAPPAYTLISRLPFLQVGETYYRPLDGLRELDSYRQRVAVERSLYPLPDASEVVSAYRQGLASSTGPVPLPVLDDGSRWSRLLRFPVLCQNRDERDAISVALKGLGVSKMYGQTLADLPGVPAVHDDGLPNSRRFAERLATLPTHSGVTPAALERILAALQAF